jgi:hypothetical protein
MRGRPLQENYDLDVALANIKADEQRTYLSTEFKITFWQNKKCREICRLEEQQKGRREQRKDAKKNKAYHI